MTRADVTPSLRAGRGRGRWHATSRVTNGRRIPEAPLFRDGRTRPVAPLTTTSISSQEAGQRKVPVPRGRPVVAESPASPPSRVDLPTLGSTGVLLVLPGTTGVLKSGSLSRVRGRTGPRKGLEDPCVVCKVSLLSSVSDTPKRTYRMFIFGWIKTKDLKVKIKTTLYFQTDKGFHLFVYKKELTDHYRNNE